MLPRLLSTLVMCMGVATGAWAQLAEQTGLVGTVTDSGGGVIPGAGVTAVIRPREPWAKGQYVPLRYRRAAVEEAAAHRLTLVPAK
jgi:Ni/Co efflux regulator RcnB